MPNLSISSGESEGEMMHSEDAITVAFTVSLSSHQEAGTVLVVDGLPPCGGGGPWLEFHH